MKVDGGVPATGCVLASLQAGRQDLMAHDFVSLRWVSSLPAFALVARLAFVRG